MKVYQKIIQPLLRQIDLFSNPHFITYNKKHATSTTEGLICSLLLWTIIFILFFVKLVDVTSGKVVASYQSSSSQLSPVTTKVIADGNKFMLAISAKDIKLDYPLQTPIFALVQQRYTNSSSNYLPTQQCTKDHFSSISNIDSVYQQLNMQTWLCLKKNSQFNLKGQPGAKDYSWLILVIQCPSCDNETSFRVNIHLLNSKMDPNNSSSPVNYFLDNSNFMVLQRDVTAYGNLQIQKYSINTKSSFSSSQVGSGLFTPRIGQKYTSSTIGNKQPQAFFTIKQSQSITSVYRETESLLNLFAFIGGISLFLITIFYIFKHFSTSNYRVTLASQLYREEQPKGYSIRYYLAKFIVKLLKAFGYNIKWEKTTEFHEIEQKIASVTDIRYMEKRLQFAQTALSIIFEKHQLKALYLATSDDLKNATEKFKMHRTKREMAKHLKKLLNSASISKKKQNLCESLQTIIPDEIKKTELKDELPMSMKDLCNNINTHSNINTEENADKNDLLKRQTIQKIMENYQNYSDSSDEQDDDFERNFQNKMKETRKQIEKLQQQALNDKEESISKKLLKKLKEKDESLVNFILNRYFEAQTQQKGIQIQMKTIQIQLK